LKQSLQPVDRPILISVQPRFAERILSGEKVLEFRRVWAASPVDAIAIYSSSPVRRIVGVAHIKNVHRGSPTSLWELAKEKGGGISRRQLYEYFRGKQLGYAIELDQFVEVDGWVDPRTLFTKFRPPQSFHYLDTNEFQRIIAGLAAE
jgi:predicted transcriptional regulator